MRKNWAAFSIMTIMGYLLTLLMLFWGAPFIRVMRQRYGSLAFWVTGLALSLTLVDAWFWMAFVWVTVGLYSELEAKGVRWIWNGMVILIKGLEGPYLGKSFKVGVGMILGRKQGDILLEDDSTVSSLHGRVISLPNGNLALQDAGSQNKFLVGGKKKAQVELKNGVTFQIGQSVFMVVEASEKEAAGFTLVKSWKEIIFDHLENNHQLETSGAKALSPSVQVECLQGPSADNIWFLGFGPRLFGPLSEDIEILEKDSGDLSFEISQSYNGPVVRALSQNVLINKTSATEKALEDGDEIQVGSSLFKIRLGK